MSAIVIAALLGSIALWAALQIKLFRTMLVVFLIVFVYHWLGTPA